MIRNIFLGAFLLFLIADRIHGKPLDVLEDGDDILLEEIGDPAEITEEDDGESPERKGRQFGFSAYGGFGGHGGGFGGHGGGFGGYGQYGNYGGYGNGYHGHSHYAPSFGHGYGGYDHGGYGHGGYGHGGFGGYGHGHYDYPHHHHHHHGYGRGFNPEDPVGDFNPQNFHPNPFFAFADPPVPLGVDPFFGIPPRTEMKIPVSVIDDAVKISIQKKVDKKDDLEKKVEKIPTEKKPVTYDEQKDEKPEKKKDCICKDKTEENPTEKDT